MGGKGKFRLRPQQLMAWDQGGADVVQRLICQAKLDTDPTVVEALDGSGDRPLLHQDDRAKADTPWGGRIDNITGKCVGLNKLGVIWMEMRDACVWRPAGGGASGGGAGGGVHTIPGQSTAAAMEEEKKAKKAAKNKARKEKVG